MNFKEIEKNILRQFGNPSNMTLADDLALYRSNGRYRWLQDRDEKNLLSKAEKLEMQAIYLQAQEEKERSMSR